MSIGATYRKAIEVCCGYNLYRYTILGRNLPQENLAILTTGSCRQKFDYSKFDYGNFNF